MRTPKFAAILAIAAVASAQKPPTDTILRAMQDELQRSRSLRVVGLDDAPYYIQYSIEDVDNYSASATLGALLASSRNRARVPRIAVRAGSYDFDNTNHLFSGRYSGARYDPDQWPIDDNYAAIRYNLWLATDRSYKTALESIARKRASLKNAAAPDKAPDFAKSEPVVLIQPVAHAPIDEAKWKQRAIDFSRVFAAYPEISVSGVDSSVFVGTSYFVDTEGAAQRTPDMLVQLRAQAQAQAADGMVIHDARTFQSLTTDGVSDADMRKGVVEVAENLRALLKAPMAEAYSGPVLFEAEASAQLMAQLLGDNLRVVRRPVSEPGRPAPTTPGELESKMGSKILPEWMNVADDPTQTEWRGRKLLGSYPTDMEGVAPKPVLVVEKGVLKSFLLTRQPASGFTSSNGHARLPGNFGGFTATISNLFINASETKPLPDLKKQLIEMVRQRNKPYGILVRKLDYPSSASVNELQSIGASLRGSNTRPVSPPILVYKVFPDGREELVRGLRFRGLSTRSLRDIVAASNENFVFDFVNNGAPFAFLGVGGYLAPTSVVSPSLLFEEVEFETPQDELSKPPIVPPPPIESVSR